MFKKLTRTLIEGLLYIVDHDHRLTEQISDHDDKKFTHVQSVEFQCDYSKAVRAVRTVPYPAWELQTNTHSLVGADRHRIIRDNGEPAWLENLKPGDQVRTESGIEAVVFCRPLGIRVHMNCLELANDESEQPKTHHFYSNGILSHNTTCAAGFLLWKAMFAPDTTILIAANKLVQALEIMDRIRYAYENLPDHIRAGVNEYNKGTITFDNGSKIVSRATSPDAGRGLSITMLYLDEFAFVHPNKASEFWTSIQPVLSTGGACIITSTPKNDEDQFAQIWKGAIDNTDEFGNPRPGKLGKNKFFGICVPWHEHPERDEEWASGFRETLGEARFRQEFCCVTGDTLVVVRKPGAEPRQMPILSLRPLLSMMGERTRLNLAHYEVLTPSGFQPFVGLADNGLRALHELAFGNHHTLRCTSNHRVMTPDGAKTAAELRVGDWVLAAEGHRTRVVTNRVTGTFARVYDLVEVAGGHEYYTNGIVSHNCDFVSDDETLINPLTLTRLTGKLPVQYTGTVRWFAEPKANKTYLVGLDPSLGTGRDNAAMQVFQLPEMIQVAEWQHNQTAPRGQVRVLLQTLLYLDDYLRDHPEQRGEPDIYWTVENNSLGEAILTIIEDSGEERFPGIIVSEKRSGSGRRFRKGLTTTNRNKLAACARMKSLVESGRMEVRSANLIREFKNFVATENSFKAKLGESDDLVMAAILIVRMLDVVLSHGADAGDLREHIDDEELSEGEAMPVAF